MLGDTTLDKTQQKVDTSAIKRVLTFIFTENVTTQKKSTILTFQSDKYKNSNIASEENKIRKLKGTDF